MDGHIQKRGDKAFFESNMYKTYLFSSVHKSPPHSCRCYTFHCKMSTDKMSNGKMSTDKMSNDKMSTDKMSNDKMSTDKMSNDKMSNDKMSNDKMSTFMNATECRTSQCSNDVLPTRQVVE
jgi:pentapeptide MXKDX repeat protein